MLPTITSADPPSRGPLLIIAGLAIVLAAQLWPAIPLATAIGLIGWGTTLTICAWPNRSILLATNFSVYATLVLFAWATQLHSATDALWGGLQFVDSLLAAVLLVALARYVVRAILPPRAYDP